MLLAIDPSVNHVGWATSHIDARSLGLRFNGGTIDLTDWESTHYKVEALVSILKGIIDETEEIDEFVYEQATFQTSDKGRIAAQKGYTINLGFVAGFVAGSLNLPAACIFGYTPMQWKGNVPKSATEAKFKRYINKQKIIHIDSYDDMSSEHEMDALMILVHHLEETGVM